MKLFLFFLSFLSIHSCQLETSPTIERRESRYYDNYSDKEFFITEYHIYNKTGHCYYTWLFSNQQKSSGEETIESYFFKPYGDFSFSQLINDNMVFRDGFEAIVGISFIKQLLPGDSFSYIIISDRFLDDDSDIQKSIIIEEKKNVETIIGSIPDMFLFPLGCIVLRR